MHRTTLWTVAIVLMFIGLKFWPLFLGAMATTHYTIRDWEEYYAFQKERNQSGPYVPGRIFGHSVNTVPIVPFLFYYERYRPDGTFIVYDSHNPHVCANVFQSIRIDELELIDDSQNRQTLVSTENGSASEFLLKDLGLNSPNRGRYNFKRSGASGFQVRISGSAVSSDGLRSPFVVDEPWHFGKGKRFEVEYECWTE